MRFSTRTELDDHREFACDIAYGGVLKRRSRMIRREFAVCGIFLLLVVLSGLWSVGVDYSEKSAAEQTEPAIVLALVICVGLFSAVLAFAYLLAKTERKLKATEEEGMIYRDGLKEGLDIGPTEVAADEKGVSIAFADNKSIYAWQAFRAFEERENAFFLIVDRSFAEIVPKRELDAPVLAKFRALLTSHLPTTSPGTRS